MLTRPVIEDPQIVVLLLEGYGIEAATIEFLPIGADPGSASFRVTSSDGLYFLKARLVGFDPVPPDVARHLSVSGITEVIAPLPTLAGASSFRDDNADWLLYPYVEGTDGLHTPMSQPQWTAFGSALRAVHASTLPAGLAVRVRREDFAARWRDRAREVERRIDAGERCTDGADGLATLWAERRDEIGLVIDRAEELAARVAAQRRDLVVCHADLHAGNVLIGSDGALGIVDWDEVMLAPRERDLMFVGGGVGGTWNDAAELLWFTQAYGAAPDDLLLAYYRYERIATDLAVTGLAILDETQSAQDQALSLQHAAAQFLPRNVVEIAHRTYARL